jgi:hypothetical protein
LVDNGEKNDDQAMRTFHHEFSSLLMKSRSFWINPWTDYNPKDFQYLTDIHDTWKEVEEASLIYTDNSAEDYEKGFEVITGLLIL